jgi:hypothetical protein
MTDTDLQNTALRLVSWFTTGAVNFLFEILMAFGDLVIAFMGMLKQYLQILKEYIIIHFKENKE